MKYLFFIFFLITFIFNFTAVKQTIKYVIPSEYKVISFGIFILLTVLLYVYQFFSSYFAENFSYAVNKILSYVVYYYLGFIIYAFMIYILVFCINFFLTEKINLYPLAFFIVIITLIMGTFFKYNTVITKYQLQKENYNISAPLNIVLVSDIHLGFINGNKDIEKMTEKINSLNPDVVLIAGDLVDMHLKPVIEKNMFAGLKKIKSKYGTFFVLGNHDIYNKKSEKITELLKENNIYTLRDEKIYINNEFYIAGRDNFSKTSLEEILAEKEDNKSVILMEHTPDKTNEAIENNIFLQVSGHTHKGQFFPGRIFTKRIFPIDYGYKKTENTNIIVSSGYGTWGPPLRIGSHSEICLIKIK